MNRRAIFFGGMAIVTVSIFFGHMIGTEKVLRSEIACRVALE